MGHVLQLFGHPALRRADAAADGTPLLAPGKPLALLAVLATAPGRAVDRDALIAQLWGASTGRSARQTLRQTLHSIRKKAGDILLTEGDAVRLDPAVAVDRDAFLLALDADEPETALSHYGGDFFPAFAAPGGAGFEQAADVERRRLRTLAVAAAERVVRRSIGKGRAREAVATGRLIRDRAPHEPAPWRLLLESLVALGADADAAAELAAYRAWCRREERPVDAALVALVEASRAGAPERDRVAEVPARTVPLDDPMVHRERRDADASEVSAEPSAGSGEAIEAGADVPVPPGLVDGPAAAPDSPAAAPSGPAAARSAATDAARTPGGPPPSDADRRSASRALLADLVGRGAAMDALRGQWRTARRGRRRHVHIVADAGLGKSRLLDAFARRLRLDRRTVVSVRATPADRAIPFALAADLAAALADCPGAAGVSAATARVLVALAPRVSESLRAEPDEAPPDDLLRRRTLALEELIAAVADEAPLALLVDDVHWADAGSRALLARLAAADTDEPVLLVTAARPTLGAFGEPDAVLPLPALRPADVAALVENLGALPDAPWARLLPAQLHAASGGVPLDVLELLELARARDLLRLGPSGWRCDDAEALAALFTGRGPIVRLVESLAPEERRLLHALALLGVAAPEAALAGAAERPVARALEALERRGLARESEGAWSVGHDAVADAISAAADAEAHRAAHALAARVARALPGVGDRRLVYAARHAAAAGEDVRAAQDFAALVAARLAGGDRTAQAALAREVLGETAGPDDVRRLVRSLPWRVRTDVPRFAGLAAVAAAVLLLTAAFAWRGAARGAADAGDAGPALGSFVLVWKDSAGARLVEVPVRDGDLRSDGTGRLYAQPVAGWAGRDVAPLLDKPIMLARGDTLFGWHPGPDVARGTDAFAIAPTDSSPRALLGLPGDDLEWTPSADGRFAVYLHDDGARSNDFRIRLVRRDLASGSEITLVEPNDRLAGPRWSPDGGRIAYLQRSERPGVPSAVCTIGADGTRRRCDTLATGGVTAENMLGWLDDTTLLIDAAGITVNDAERPPGADAGGSVPGAGVEFPTASGRQLMLVSLETGRRTLIAAPRGCTELQLAPTGTLATCRRAATSREPAAIIAFDPRRPERHAALPLGADVVAGYGRGFRLPAPGPLRLRIVAPSDAVSAGGWLTLAAQRRLGASPERPAHPRWRTLDPERARVGPTGVVRGVAPGTARIEAWLLPGVADTIRLAVLPRSPDAERASSWREDWSRPVADRWIPFGTPPVRVVRLDGPEADAVVGGPDGGTARALFVAGDEAFSSGVYARTAVAARRGAGAEARVRLPISQAFQQMLYVGLSGVPAAALEAWRATAPAVAEEIPKALLAPYQSMTCFVAAPGGEGGDRSGTIAFVVGTEGRVIEVRRTPVADSAWHDVRIQLFEDGRCGLAIDGRVVSVSPPQVTAVLPDSLRVFIEGRSVDTRILVGPLVAWSGVRDDVDWASAFEAR